MAFQVVAAFTNTESLCIGEITRLEAEIAGESNPLVDGTGLYLLAIDRRDARKPGKVLAKLADEGAAQTLAQYFRLHGQIESDRP